VIAIVDYGAGNITSVKRAIEHLGHAAIVTSDEGVIETSDRIIVPGVGNFHATAALFGNGLATALKRQISLRKPLLGICLGMQWLFEFSDEAPGIQGLGLLDGTCHALPAHVKSPHVGWDQLEIRAQTRLLRGIDSGRFVYFTHRYCAPLVDATAAACDYGSPFSAAVERDNIFGVQFHPEKSGETGLAILRNFCTC
jgi:imidazole glycerol-phosphate synthase subunit HisH